ncbi:hypothetical protein MCOR25_004435 [Pyricularia grisea]|nr:hypothetical protein MCOR25_004435 [Pyricularia grisea]
MSDPTAQQTPSLSIREATPSDLPSLQPLVQKAYRGDASRKGWTTEADLVAGQRIDAPGLLSKINAPLGAVLLAFPAGSDEPVACCEVVCRDDSRQVAYFGLFAVDPERQGGGLGKIVLQKAEQYVKDTWGAARMEMTVIWIREELIAWYERRGYSRTGEKRPFPYGEPENGLPLRDDLYFDVLVKDL